MDPTPYSQASPTEMGLIRLIYASRASGQVDWAELHSLCLASSQKNASNGITGILLYCDGFFIQMLEGSNHMVRSRFRRIRLDPRHTDVHILSVRAIADRECPNSMMLYALDEAENNFYRSRASRFLQEALDGIDNELGDDALQLITEMRFVLETDGLGAVPMTSAAA